MDEEERRTAIGLAGYEIAIALMAVQKPKKVLSNEERRAVLETALLEADKKDERHPGSFQNARAILQTLLGTIPPS